MSAITRMEAQEWANRLQVTRRARHKGKTVTSDDEDVPLLGAETVCAAVHLMSQLYHVAMKETPPIVMINPSAGAVERLGKALAAGRHGEQDQLMANVAAYSGLRWGEIAALTIG